MTEATTKTIEIPEELGGGSVEIRARIGYLDTVAIEGAQIGVRLRGGLDREKAAELSAEEVLANIEEFVEIEFDARKFALAKLNAYVVRWTLRDSQGEPLPADGRGFRSPDFAPEVGAFIVKAADAFYREARYTKS